jgi:hypothetical protein
MMEQVFNMTTSWTWDIRHGGKLRLVRLGLSVLRMMPIADKTTGITVIMFSFDCCPISNASS